MYFLRKVNVVLDEMKLLQIPSWKVALLQHSVITKLLLVKWLRVRNFTQ